MSSSKINLNQEIIALFSGQSSVVTTPKLYIKLTGSHSLGAVLNQCVFWSNKSKHKDGWFYKQYHEWFDEVHIPERTLRRRFDRLEQSGWISTKIKKTHGINMKHIYVHMDKIIESISSMLDTDCPDRPLCPSGTESEQNTCTKVAPTGQSGRLEPATLADSTIYTDNYNQKKLTNCESSSSFFFSEDLDNNLLDQKLFQDTRTDKEFLESVVRHVDFHSDKKFSRIVRIQGAIKLLKKMKANNIIFYVAGEEPKEEEKEIHKNQGNPHFTEEEVILLADLKAGMKLGKPDMFFSGKTEKFKIAQDVYAKEQELIKSCQIHSPKSSAKKNSLASALKSVFRQGSLQPSS